MKKILVSFLILAVLLIGLTACGGKTVKIDESANGQSIPLEKGETLSIVLAGNPTTGYNWELAEVDQNILKPLGEAEYKSASLLIGSGGAYTFKFEAVGSGSTALKLIYYRSFEKDVPPVNTYTITVSVN